MVNSIAQSIKRDTCPIRRSFVERESGSDSPTPLAALLRTRGSVGGKGGGLRIALLMSLIWVNARPPYSTGRVSAFWAELLGRSDPRSEGARVIRDALHELADRDLVHLRSSGAKTEIALRNESNPVNPDGTPAAYVPPYGIESYLPVPRTFWTEGLAGKLSGAGVAMYLCSLALTRSDDPEFFISANHFDDRYGISRSSRKRGLTELAEHGVLTIHVEEALDASTFRKVRRNIYRLDKKYRQPAAWVPPTATKDEDSKTQAAEKLRRSTQSTKTKAVRKIIADLNQGA